MNKVLCIILINCSFVIASPDGSNDMINIISSLEIVQVKFKSRESIHNFLINILFTVILLINDDQNTLINKPTT